MLFNVIFIYILNYETKKLYKNKHSLNE